MTFCIKLGSRELGHFLDSMGSKSAPNLESSNLVYTE